MSKILWQPSKDFITNSNMYRFIEYAKHYDQKINHYSALYQWSINHPEQFWEAIWQFCDIKASKSAQSILENNSDMINAKWFSGAKLNFAENLLRTNDSTPALIFHDESGTLRSLTYAELNKLVARLANRLRAENVQVNDRIAGILPNMPEAVIAMLATTSIGAIWSSCSPDFGTEAILDRLQQIQPKILFMTDGHFYNGKKYDAIAKISRLQTLLPSLQKTIVIPYLNDEIDTSHLSEAKLYSDFIAKADDKNVFEQLPFDHPVYILFSSGTTGAPKCIVHGAGGTLLQHLKELVLHTDLKKQDTIFYYTTCGWMMWNWYISSLAVGASVLQYDGSPFFPNPTRLFDILELEKVSVFGTSAKYLSAVEKYQLHPRSTHPLSNLRTILSTGSPLMPINFDYVYEHIKSDVCLSSISGGTDIISCFVLGNPILPVYRGEIQCRGLGMKIEIFDELGKPVIEKKGELVCTAPFPSRPIYFWNDPDGTKYRHAYFEKYPNVWTHGDYAEITKHDGVIIYGRSDAILNPGGIRIGTAEIYRQVEKLPEIFESIAVGQEWENDVRIILFVVLNESYHLDEALKLKIKNLIRENASPHHLPAKIIQVADIPRTINGKIVELAVREIIHHRSVKNKEVLANPDSLKYFENLKELQD